MFRSLCNEQTIMASTTSLRLQFMSREDLEVAKSHPPPRSPCIWPIWHNLGTRNRNLANLDYFSLPSQISIGHYQIFSTGIVFYCIGQNSPTLTNFETCISQAFDAIASSSGGIPNHSPIFGSY